MKIKYYFICNGNYLLHSQSTEIYIYLARGNGINHYPAKGKKKHTEYYAIFDNIVWLE